MKKNSKFLIAILISLQLLGATELTVKELVKKMQSQRETIHSYTADILNTVEGSLIQGKKVERGRIIFQEPDTIRSETIDPFQLTLTVSGKTYLIDKSGKSTEIEKEKSSLDKQFSDPLALLNKFNFVITESDTETIKLVGLPKSNSEKDYLSSRYFSKIVFYIDARKYLTKEIRLHDRKGAELADILTDYQEISGINFPIKTITKLSFGKSLLRITTSYQNIILNQELDPELFALEKITAALKMSGASQ
jgi:outer membrane lipoprotein-sorting protein